MTVRIVVCGLGRVGRAFLKLLAQKAGAVQAKYALDLQVVAAVDLGGAAVAEAGLVVPELLRHLEAGGPLETMPDRGRPGLRGAEVVAKIACDVLVEATPTSITDGEPGLTHIRAALENGRHVVTASKGPLVLRHAELKSAAERHRVRLMISAAAAAALPTLDVALTCLAGTEILQAEGILNGTTNYILTRMTEDGCGYAEALQEARAMGVAEPDPTLDVTGRDTANKILLVANEVFGAGLTLGQIPVRGIDHLTSEDVARATSEGRRLKLIGRVERQPGQVAASVAPVALPLDHPLVGVRGTEKAISYLTDTMDRVTVSGGKSDPVGAAAALLKDIIRIYEQRQPPG